MANVRSSHKSGFHMRGGVQRRESLWLDFAPAQTTFAAASTAVLMGSLNAAALALRPFTVVRTRGYMFVRSDQSGASETYGCSVGYCIVSDQATAIGVTAVPTPVTDVNSDLWYAIDRLSGFFLFDTAVGVTGGIGARRDTDSKAMRKVEDGQDIVLVGETASFDQSCILECYSRFLIKLH